MEALLLHVPEKCSVVRGFFVLGNQAKMSPTVDGKGSLDLVITAYRGRGSPGAS